MNDSLNCVGIDVELDKEDVEALDREAARLGCTRNDVICKALDIFLERHGYAPESKKLGADASRAGHTAGKPPTAE